MDFSASKTVVSRATSTHLPADYYSDFLSEAAKLRKPAPIHSLFHLETKPGIISVLGGKPNLHIFPFTSFRFVTRNPVEPSNECSLSLEPRVLKQGLQYAPSEGLTTLIEWLIGLQVREHGRPRSEGWRVSVTSGSRDAIDKAIQVMVNRGDPVLVEKPTYAGTVPLFQNLSCEAIEIGNDAEGIEPSSLRVILDRWPTSKPRPKILYTMPYGCNPEGTAASLERRLEILKLARQYNLIILEDDPYYYLYFGDRPRVPSYFALEAQCNEVGRVLRFDSFSDVLSPGLRVGFATGPEPLVRAIDMHTAVSSLQAPSLSQAVLFALFQSWGYDGWKRHTLNVSQFYRQKRDLFQAAIKRHLSGLAEWTLPEAGVFFWFKVLYPNGQGDSAALIRGKAYEEGVLALPGTVFCASDATSPYVCASFGLLDEEDADEALRRLRTAIIKERGGL